MIGDGTQVVIVDPVLDRVLRTVELPAGPEFAAADARGKVYVNLESTAQLAKVDIATGHVDAVWQLTGCKSPHGIAYDPRTGRLFIAHGDTKIKSPRGNFRELRFGWDNAEVAIFRPND